MTDLELFRVYLAAGPDGYPAEWYRIPGESHGIKDIVREQAGNRCIRCYHPYLKGTVPMERTVVNGEEIRTSWSPCDEFCRHAGPMRIWTTEGWADFDPTPEACGAAVHAAGRAEAAWRILTVHHISGVKLNCKWWNLAALCQKCHLTIQGKVRLEREFIREHTPWFKPYAAGWYAHRYLNEDLTREETMDRLDELLDLELLQEALW